ncbi:MAG: ECF transporter S component [Nitrososphaerales archaeon]|nr:ECF transporter S component [Nitrososphaerales archaeon]
MPRFSRNQLLLLVAIGILTPLVNERIERLLPQLFYSFRGTVNIFDFTGGPLNSDLLIAWEEYGAVLAGYLVRKPGAATIAMTVNGILQVFVNGSTFPHIFYGVTGVGADLGYAAFRYRRYDVLAVLLAGVASQFFWIPYSYGMHTVLAVYGLSFVPGDLLVRFIGGAVGNGIFGGLLGFILVRSARLVRAKLTSGKSPKG